MILTLLVFSLYIATDAAFSGLELQTPGLRMDGCFEFVPLHALSTV